MSTRVMLSEWSVEESDGVSRSVMECRGVSRSVDESDAE